MMDYAKGLVMEMEKMEKQIKKAEKKYSKGKISLLELTNLKLQYKLMENELDMMDENLFL